MFWGVIEVPATEHALRESAGRSRFPYRVPEEGGPGFGVKQARDKRSLELETTKCKRPMSERSCALEAASVKFIPEEAGRGGPAWIAAGRK